MPGDAQLVGAEAADRSKSEEQLEEHSTMAQQIPVSKNRSEKIKGPQSAGLAKGAAVGRSGRG
jgi:hypothetical protein